MMCESGKKCCMPHWLGFALVIIGALNWGLIGVGNLMGSNWNLVEMILGSWPMVMNIVYVLVGLSGVMLLWGCKCSTCSEGKM